MPAIFHGCELHPPWRLCASLYFLCVRRRASLQWRALPTAARAERAPRPVPPPLVVPSTILQSCDPAALAQHNLQISIPPSTPPPSPLSSISPFLTTFAFRALCTICQTFFPRRHQSRPPVSFALFTGALRRSLALESLRALSIPAPARAPAPSTPFVALSQVSPISMPLLLFALNLYVTTLAPRLFPNLDSNKSPLPLLLCSFFLSLILCLIAPHLFRKAS